MAHPRTDMRSTITQGMIPHTLGSELAVGIYFYLRTIKDYRHRMPLPIAGILKSLKVALRPISACTQTRQKRLPRKLHLHTTVVAPSIGRKQTLMRSPTFTFTAKTQKDGTCVSSIKTGDLAYLNASSFRPGRYRPAEAAFNPLHFGMKRSVIASSYQIVRKCAALFFKVKVRNQVCRTYRTSKHPRRKHQFQCHLLSPFSSA